MLAGVGLYLLAASLARRGYVVLVLGSAACAGLLVVAFRTVGPFMASANDALFLTVLAGLAVLLAVVARTREEAGVDPWLLEPPRRWVLAFVLMLAPVAVATYVEDSAVVTARWENRYPTPQGLMAGLCDADGFCAPPPALVRYIREAVPIDATFAVDRHERYQPSLFLPQQMVVWTGGMVGLRRPEELFEEYYAHLDRVQIASLDQPFFTEGETRADRLAFVRDLGVTHVLVNPRLHDTMVAVLAGDADVFASRYDAGGWAVYEVVR